jgi:hypothetical protein
VPAGCAGGAGPDARAAPDAAARLCAQLGEGAAINAFPLVVLVDDSEFTARTLNNFLWVTFTRRTRRSTSTGSARRWCTSTGAAAGAW